MKPPNRPPDFFNKGSALLLALALSACSGRGPDPHEGDRSQARVRAASRRGECLDLNTAKVEELEALPGVGEKIARRIIEHRETQGPFERPEEVIIIEGFSERKYRAIASQLCAE
ncbi:MAG TPA: helix-hairpin-helix domain-containing protein [Blastocatellia bacterium]|nr:helix-hairpin-helix domain-containing protein [Blastocatellia bacterium]